VLLVDVWAIHHIVAALSMWYVGMLLLARVECACPK